MAKLLSSTFLPISVEVEFISEIDNKKKRITAYLLNLSAHGMYLGLSDENVKHLEMGTRLEIIIPAKEIDYSGCIVRSIRPHTRETIKTSSLYAVGFEFIQGP